MARRTLVPMVCVSVLVPLMAARPAVGQHRGDVWIGRTANEGALAISPSERSFVPEDNYAALGASGGALPGWTDDDPGFDSVSIATNGVLPLEPGAEIWIELVDVDPAFRLVTDSLQSIDEPGEAARFPGGYHVHEHWTWHIQSAHPAFDPDQCVWRATFFLRDEGTTGYSDSRHFTFKFTNVALRTADGDFDQDGHVDLPDSAVFAACLFGPNATPQPDDPAVTTCEVECLNAFDFDEDDDIDARDFAVLQRLLGG